MGVENDDSRGSERRWLMAKRIQKTTCVCEVSPRNVKKSDQFTDFYLDFIDGPFRGTTLVSDLGDECVVTDNIREQIINKMNDFEITTGIRPTYLYEKTQG